MCQLFILSQNPSEKSGDNMIIKNKYFDDTTRVRA